MSARRVPRAQRWKIRPGLWIRGRALTGREATNWRVARVPRPASALSKLRRTPAGLKHWHQAAVFQPAGLKHWHQAAVFQVPVGARSSAARIAATWAGVEPQHA